ncbi:hypothetical protein BpHYR1_012799 [Brachionus plicatilis]|uniref:RNA-directed DNA polymerase from mobile element jockey-like n=1 Tax=Brachionus plicatilis TaxID=10195 RepID=A0A3M7QSB0_BRAPC|nr:hypothetical protein BpHYR1_012799 [Brachionus plicatilis]
MESSDISSGLESEYNHESSYSSESISSVDNEEGSNRSNLRIENSDVTSLARTISSPDNSNSNIPCTKAALKIKEATSALKRLKEEAVSGPDQIHNLMLKYSPQNILNDIIYPLSLSLRESKIPNPAWKSANVTVIPKMPILN